MIISPCALHTKSHHTNVNVCYSDHAVQKHHVHLKTNLLEHGVFGHFLTYGMQTAAIALCSEYWASHSFLFFVFFSRVNRTHQLFLIIWKIKPGRKRKISFPSHALRHHYRFQCFFWPCCFFTSHHVYFFCFHFSRIWTPSLKIPNPCWKKIVENNKPAYQFATKK